MANYKSRDEVSSISLDELKKYLWGAAVLLRGQIDATGYKEYIFPLLFFKRLCDVYDEEYHNAFILSDGDDDFAKASTQIAVIPEGAHWNDVRNTRENIGGVLVSTLIKIEQANPPEEINGRMIGGLTGIFGEKRIWTNKDIISDRLLSDLLEHFSKLTLSLAACPEDEMGTGYEYLVGKFADDAGHTAQEFYTNRTVVELMAEILKPQSNESIYDPTCGSGGMLIKSLSYVRDHGLQWKNVKVFGQELNSLTASIARMNLFLHGVMDYTIVNADTLSNPMFIENGQLQKFDVVLANPPYSIKQWNRDAFTNDKYGRNIWGTPPQGRADYAFFQHIVCSMKKETGRCAILFPHGVLFRNEERVMRERLINSDLLECIIGLGSNLFFNSPMEACIIICKAKKTTQHSGKVLIINAVNDVTRNNAQSFLENKHISKIIYAVSSYSDIDNFSKVVTVRDIAANGYDLSIAKYVTIENNDNTVTCDLHTSLSELDNCFMSVDKELNILAKMIN